MIPEKSNKMKKLTIILCFQAFVLSLFSQKRDFQLLTGSYLGQKPPGIAPVLFAPGVVSTKADEYALEVSASGDEILFVRDASIMLVSRNRDGTWNDPSVAPFSGKYVDGEPCFSPDGNKIYFMSRRPLVGSKIPSHLWVSEKKDHKWSDPYPVSGIIHDKQLHAPSIAADGSIYEDGIIRFEYTDGRYRPAERLAVDGGFPYIFPDESRIIYAKRPPGRRDRDLFMSFRKPDGTWSPGLSLGENINSPDNEGNSFVTADGRYLFFSRKFDIYWVSAEIIETLKTKSGR
jgi:hypothetical protein